LVGKQRPTGPEPSVATDAWRNRPLIDGRYLPSAGRDGSATAPPGVLRQLARLRLANWTAFAHGPKRSFAPASPESWVCVPRNALHSRGWQDT